MAPEWRVTWQLPIQYDRRHDDEKHLQVRRPTEDSDLARAMPNLVGSLAMLRIKLCQNIFRLKPTRRRPHTGVLFAAWKNSRWLLGCKKPP